MLITELMLSTRDHSLLPKIFEIFGEQLDFTKIEPAQEIDYYENVLRFHYIAVVVWLKKDKIVVAEKAFSTLSKLSTDNHYYERSRALIDNYIVEKGITNMN